MYFALDRGLRNEPRLLADSREAIIRPRESTDRNPAFIMLLVVAAVFLGFKLMPSRKKDTAKKETGK
jgi:hypothetical protein